MKVKYMFIKVKSKDIQSYILKNVLLYPSTIVSRVAKKYAISRQAAHKHLQRLVQEEILQKEGMTRKTSYHPMIKSKSTFHYTIEEGLAEDKVWVKDIRPLMEGLPPNVLQIWQHGFTEMFNNAIDHSEGKIITVTCVVTTLTREIVISDDGIGIFRKIQSKLGLTDERQALLELAKGKFTTDPARHSGEGIFFTSRMFEKFNILSGNVHFSHHEGLTEKDFIIETGRKRDGTGVRMCIANISDRTTQAIFDAYSDATHYTFNKTVVPVRLAQYGDDSLISRSQAKRILSRIDKFEKVIFDFQEVKSIGQSFADEIFRVFQNAHPHISLSSVNTNKPVQQMIDRAKNNNLVED